jgi:hypothetical protein
VSGDVPDLDALAEEFVAQYDRGGCSDRVEELFHLAMDAARAFALRAGSAEMGCEIAYRREPTEAEAEAFAGGADETSIPMGGWTARRCRVCSRWVFGGPTACVRCVEREEVEELKARIAELKVLVEDGPAAERSAIVAWLRSELHAAVTPSEFATARALKHAADLIEENAHMPDGVASEDVGP